MSSGQLDHMKFTNVCFFLIYFLSATCNVGAQVVPLPKAHAHNDYLHEHPLKDALRFGFTSVEADVYSINGELYVSHERPEKLTGITLKELYLNPLQSLMRSHNATVYPNYYGEFYLLIDIKDDAVETYKVLKEQLLTYPELLRNPHFKIYLTSFQDIHFVLNDPARVVGIDGRLGDLNKGYGTEQVPVVSESFQKITRWNGKDSLTANQFELVKQFISKVHAEGKKCRVWAIPDEPNAWRRLLADGIDFINTDRLEAFSDFMAKHN